jgi:hypothetical protein
LFGFGVVIYVVATLKGRMPWCEVMYTCALIFMIFAM